jgi:uncharacterized protein (TIGR02679 family)
MQDKSTTTDLQKAVVFFRQSGLSRLVERLREKYIELGRAGGQIILENSTASERQAVASFLGKPLSSDVNLRVRVADVEKAITHSFGCSLPALLNAYFPGRPLVTRQEQRASRTARQDAFHQQLASITDQLPEESRGRRWLLHGPHGLEWLFSRYKNESAHEQEQQVELVRYVAHALDQLPQADTPERLALFAQRTSGDPHTLDADRPAGRLFLYALADLARNTTGSTSESNDADDGFLDASSEVPKDREQVLRLYADVGLLVDTISSNVAVFNLAGAVYCDSTPDALVQAAGERVLLLPLRQLLEWQSVVPARSDIYIFENPQVFEEVIFGLSSHGSNKLPGRSHSGLEFAAPGQNLLPMGFLSTETIETSVPMETTETSVPTETNVVPQGQPVWGIGALPGGQIIPPHPTSLRPYGHDNLLPQNLPLRGEQPPPILYDDSHRPPTMICTSGWPSTAALKLLQMFVDQSPGNRLYYSGDFDLKGLQIAASLIARYAGRCYPWRFDVESYAFALRAGGVTANAVELAALSMLPEVFAPLVAVMREKKMWAYQEGIVRLLTKDVKINGFLP